MRDGGGEGKGRMKGKSRKASRILAYLNIISTESEGSW